MDGAQEEHLVEQVGHFAYALLMRLRLRDQTRPAKAPDFVTSTDRHSAINRALRTLEAEGLLTREATMIPDRGKVVYYRTNVDNDPLRRRE